MSLGVSINNTTKGFCEILLGTDQARQLKFISCGFAGGFAKTVDKNHIYFAKTGCCYVSSRSVLHKKAC